jgi:hypothetical protein
MALLAGGLLSGCDAPPDAATASPAHPAPTLQAPAAATATTAAYGDVQGAIAARARDRWVQGEGRVRAVLADDRRGSRHQRFVLALAGGATVLVAHNIDLAPRVEGLHEGDTVAFAGEYEWNDRGGVVHWTHHDPQGRRDGGWLRHSGRSYR